MHPHKGEVEIKLAGIWQDLLGLERVGRFDHFLRTRRPFAIGHAIGQTHTR